MSGSGRVHNQLGRPVNALVLALGERRTAERAEAAERARDSSWEALERVPPGPV
ncbi:hypothetical protein ABZ746_06980 [Streptomyces sp. NPDC020096]